VLEASVKLRDWYMRLGEYKKAGLVKTGLGRRVLEGGAFQLVKAETTGPDKDRITPRITETAKLLF
jgi:trk system potassium uptake protein TrkH